MPDARGTVSEFIIREMDRIKALSEDAARSGAYFYPVKGVLYYLTHHHLWAPLLSQFVPILTLSIGVLVFMFVFTYVPQMAVLAAMSGPFAVVGAGLLVVSESSAIVGFLSSAFLMEKAVVDTFDVVLVEKGMASLVSEGRQINANSRDTLGKLGKLIKRPFTRFSLSSAIRYLVYFPLNFIPMVGPGIFLVLQGKRAGPMYHDRYFQLKGWSNSQSKEWVEKQRGAYTSFGMATVLLEIIPLASIFFAFTNTVGAALWAADMERENGRVEQKAK